MPAFRSGQAPFLLSQMFFLLLDHDDDGVDKGLQLDYLCIFTSGFTQRPRNQTFQIDAKDIILG